MGYLQGHGLVIDARGEDSYDINAMVKELGSVSKDVNVVRHFVLVDKKEKEEVVRQIGAIPIIVSKDDPKVLEKIEAVTRGFDLKNSNISVALTEAEAGIVATHYRIPSDEKSRFNFLIADTGTKSERNDQYIPAAALFVLLAKLASQNQTTTITISCSKETIDQIRGALSTLHLIAIRWRDIGKLFTEFLTSFMASATAA